MSLETIKKFTEKICESVVKLVKSVNKEALCQLLVVCMTIASSMFPKVAPIIDYISYLVPYISLILVCIWNWYRGDGNDKSMLD